MKQWNVRVHRNGLSRYIGTVYEKTEELARCAALSMYGRDEDEPYDELLIGPDDEFDVSEMN